MYFSLTNRKIKYFNIIWVINNILYFFLLDYKSIYVYESLSIRIISTFLCLIILFYSFKNKLSKTTYYLAEFNIYFSLPFFFTFMLIKSNISAYWLLNCMSALYFTMILIPPNKSLKWIFLAIIIAIIMNYQIFPYDLIQNMESKKFKYSILTFIAPVIIGYLFINNKHKEEQELLDYINSNLLNRNVNFLNRIIKNETSKLLSPEDILEKDILGLNLLFDELNDLLNKIKSNKDNQDLLKIREYILKLNDGFKHLKAITEKKTSVKLNLINCDIISILESVKKELGCYHTFDEDILKFSVPGFNSKIKLDSNLIKFVLETILIKLIKHNVKVLVSIEQSPVKIKSYKVNNEKNKFEVDGIKICIKYIFPKRHFREFTFNDLLLNPIEINCCSEIIELHYGVFNNHQELNQFHIILPKNIDISSPEIEGQLENNISNVFIATNLISGFYALTIKEIQATLYKKGFSYKDISKITNIPFF
jgi:hypothetical protein